MNRKKCPPPAAVQLDKNTENHHYPSYSYASIEFRPVKITDDGAISTPVETNASNDDNTYNSPESDKDIYDSPGSIIRVTVGRGRSEDNQGEPVRQRDCSNDYYDSVADPIQSGQGDDSVGYYDSVVDQQSTDQIQDIYAKIDYSKKKKKYKDVDSTENSTEMRHQNVESVYSSVPNGDSDGNTNIIPEKVGNSKFFVNIPEKRGNKPPLAPKPFIAIATTSEKKSPYKGLRKQSAPAIIQRDLPSIPTNAKDRLKSETWKKYSSSDDLIGSKHDLTDLSPESGKSSVESSSRSDSAKSKESPDDSGESLYADPNDVDVKELLRKAEELVSDELPEGWQEVRDGNETYYWHIWTGTIQYERPIFTPTPSSSSRSISPLSSSIDSGSSKSTSVSDIHERASQSKSPPQGSRTESPPEKPKQAIGFPVHSMGWLDVTEDTMGPTQLGETVNNCISSLAEQRKDLWQIAETWGEGRDIKLLLEGQVLKLVEPKSKEILLQQPIAKMRVWGVGREDQRDFAYIAREKETGKHRCHMFRCHGNVSGRSITNALHTICNRVLDEKRKIKERSTSPSPKSGSDLLNAPLTTSTRVGTGFNEKPFIEQKKSFSAKYVGWTEVTKSSGIDMLNKAVSKLTTTKSEEDWKTVLIEVTTSEVRTIDCLTQGIIMEDRVRFVSFLGIAKDERMCGYIVAAGLDMFVCHVYYCVPHGGALTRAIEEACRLRFEKVLDKHAPEGVKSPDENQQPIQQKSSVKEKGLKSSMQGLFNKLQRKDSKMKDDIPLHPSAKEHMIKYFGCVKVELGTGIDTVQGAVEQLMGGSMMVGYVEVTETSVHLSDSQRTALSRRVIDIDTVSYCGMTSDRKHFGLIVSQGRGKYVCHVFQEYKTHVGIIVSAIHDVL